METNAKKFAEYWRNSVADSMLGIGTFASIDKGFDRIRIDEWLSGKLSDKGLVDRYFSEVPAEIETVSISLRPRVYRRKSEHAQSRQDGILDYVTTVVLVARLTRSGNLHPDKTPSIARNILEPLEKGAFFIGTVDAFDTYTSEYSLPLSEDGAVGNVVENWRAIVDYCEKLEADVCCVGLMQFPEFVPQDFVLVQQTESMAGTTRHVLSLYDNMRRFSPDVPLFEALTSLRIDPPRRSVSSQNFFSQRLAHASSKYGLAAAQRDAATHLLNIKDGGVLAVNGPPGTGKTTILLSVIATEWTRSALDKAEPPVVIAASTNNQAVTNVIDSFGKVDTGIGPLAGRWLPDISSYGSYFPASDKEVDARKAGYQTEAFFEEVETLDYVERAESYFLEKTAIFIGAMPISVQAAHDAIHARLVEEAGKLKLIEMSWNALVTARINLQDGFGDEPESKIAVIRNGAVSLRTRLTKVGKTSETWKQYIADESIFETITYSLFSWLGPVRKRRLLKGELFLRSIWPKDEDILEYSGFDDIDSAVDRRRRWLKRKTEEAASLIRDADTLLAKCADTRAKWGSHVQMFGLTESASLTDCETAADQSIRFDLFRLATHYWEGRWLIEMRTTVLAGNADTKGIKKTQRKWRRRMKLTPCAVSTFYMLPKHLAAYEGENKPLYNFADLLIVDEAGQVSPEIGGASFALAKRALVIGDTLQIEPIWSVPSSVDMGNLLACGIVNPESARESLESLSNLGKTASAGSVMAAAQYVTPYHYDLDLARGMYLYEHRRCYDEIIAYCNELCYKGKLIPQRGGGSAITAPFPVMGYVHVNGHAEAYRGSRRNLVEAESIAHWLAENRHRIEEAYGLSIVSAVGVVTPFEAQKEAIRNACRRAGLPVGKGEMTIGTVHSLQGAERRLVIFSTTYSKHDQGMRFFFDRSPNMLNVAVSRAQDSFLVFGDMDILDERSGSPSGLLAKILFASESNEILLLNPVARDDLLIPNQNEVQYLKTTEDHDAFLAAVARKAKKELIIVSPWITNIGVTNSGLMECLVELKERGITVRVFTDYEFNQRGTTQKQRESSLNTTRELLSRLDAHGASTTFVSRVHSKIIICDDDLMCVGSFNWLSAARDGQYKRHEMSVVYRSPSVQDEKETVVLALEAKRVREQPKYH